MQLIAVCTGPGRPLGQKASQTGIDKRPAEGQIEVGLLGLEGDRIVNRKYHGGPDQAVYIYTRPDYDFWEARLGRPLVAGTFGENLVLSDLESASVNIGQRVQVGEVVLEATAPRTPCSTLAQHMNDPQFVRRFREARRPGVYARVLVPGRVQAGDPVSLLGEWPADASTILDAYEFGFDRTTSPEQIERLLAAPVAGRLRADLLKAQALRQAREQRRAGDR